MKQLIIVIVLVVAGYFAYQHFYGAPSDEAAMEEEEVSGEIETSAVEPPPPIPGSCSGAAKNLENAIYGSATGQVSFAQRNTTDRKFRSCLREAGFTDPQINGAVAQIEERVKKYQKQDVGR